MEHSYNLCDRFKGSTWNISFYDIFYSRKQSLALVFDLLINDEKNKCFRDLAERSSW